VIADAEETLVRDANKLAVGGLVPDLTLLLVADPAVAQERMRSRGELDRMEREDPAFHERVAAAFREAASQAWQQAHPEVGPVRLVDAEGTEAAVARRIAAELTARWPETFSVLHESQ